MKLIFHTFLSMSTLLLCVQASAYSMEFRSEQDRRREVCANVGGMFETAASLRDEGAPEHTVAGVMAGYSGKWAPEITLELAEKIVKTVYSDTGFLIAGGGALNGQMRQACIDGNIPYLKFYSSASADKKKTTKKQDCLLLAGTLASIPIWRDNGVSLMKVQTNMAEALENTGEGKGEADSKLWSGMASDIYRSKVSSDDVYVGLRQKCDKMQGEK